MSIENVDPIDYEEFLDEHREKIDLDPLKHLLEYPIDDVDFIRIERQYRTIIPVMPEKEFENENKSSTFFFLIPFVFSSGHWSIRIFGIVYRVLTANIFIFDESQSNSNSNRKRK